MMEKAVTIKIFRFVWIKLKSMFQQSVADAGVSRSARCLVARPVSSKSVRKQGRHCQGALFYSHYPGGRDTSSLTLFRTGWAYALSTPERLP